MFLLKQQLTLFFLRFCPCCKEFVRATKKFDLWRLPEILVIHLKRFSFSRMWYDDIQNITYKNHQTDRSVNGRRNKLSSFVDFPLEGLDLSEYTLCEQDGGTLYDLYAVSVILIPPTPAPPTMTVH